MKTYEAFLFGVGLLTLESMTIKDLKEKIAELPDDMLVMIPVNPSDAFDGLLFTPCIEESEVIEMGLDDIPEEDIAEMELLNKPIPEESSFMLVPCGYFDRVHDPAVELN